MSDHPVPLNTEDVQGNILSSYGVGCARYLFYRIDLSDGARRGLAALIGRITTETQSTSDHAPPKLNLAFTFQGLKNLGLSPNSLNSFPPSESCHPPFEKNANSPQKNFTRSEKSDI